MYFFGLLDSCEACTFVLPSLRICDCLSPLGPRNIELIYGVRNCLVCAPTGPSMYLSWEEDWSVCVSVTQHLTFHVIIRATNNTNLLNGG